MGKLSHADFPDERIRNDDFSMGGGGNEFKSDFASNFDSKFASGFVSSFKTGASTLFDDQFEYGTPFKLSDPVDLAMGDGGRSRAPL